MQKQHTQVGGVLLPGPPDKNVLKNSPTRLACQLKVALQHLSSQTHPTPLALALALALARYFQF
jgi:hypothetical protein